MRVPRPFFAVAGLALALSACGGGVTASSEPSEDSTGGASPEASGEAAPAEGEEEVPTRSDADLVIWTDAVKVDAVTAVGDTFAEDNGISVDVQVVSSDLQSNFVTANSAGNGPDVVVGAHDWLGNLVQNGAIVPLQLSADQLSGYDETAVQATTYEGQLYGVPYGVEALALYRNTDVAPDEVASLDEAIAVGQAAVDAGDVESALNLPVGDNGDAYHMQPVLTSMGGYLFGYDEETGYDAADLGLDSEGAIAAATKIGELGESGSGVLRRSLSGDNTIALFTEGDAAFLVSGPWALNDVRASGVPYAVQPVPGFEGQGDAQPFMGAQAFMVASNAQNAAFAQEFVNNGVNNVEAMQTMFDLAQLPPALTEVRDAIAEDNPDIAVFAEAAEGANPMPALPAMSAVWEPLGTAYAAIVGGADPTSTMEQTAETIRTAIETAG